MITKKHQQSGFSLIEMLVAIAILLVAVVGPISVIGDSLRKIYYTKDEMIAINLAQEGIETVRQIRDTNMLGGAVWDTGLAAGDYTVNPTAAAPLVACATCAGVPQPIFIDTATGLYRQGAGFASTTQFSRVVTIASTGLPLTERKVTSKVSWKTGGSTGTILVSEYIFKWAL